jgi:hypothetical protein
MLVARQWTAHYVWSVHAKEATRVGLEPEIIEAIRTLPKGHYHGLSS